MSEKTTRLDFYDYGWNDRMFGKPFLSSKEGASRNWRDGWKDCDEAIKAGESVRVFLHVESEARAALSAAKE